MPHAHVSLKMGKLVFHTQLTDEHGINRLGYIDLKKVTKALRLVSECVGGHVGSVEVSLDISPENKLNIHYWHTDSEPSIQVRGEETYELEYLELLQSIVFGLT